MRAVSWGIKARGRGDTALDDAVGVLVRAVGKERVERLKKDRSRKVRDAARRVLRTLKEGQTDPATRAQEQVANKLWTGSGDAPKDRATNGGGQEDATR